MDFGNLTGKLTEWFKKYRYVLLIVLIGLAFMLIPSGNETEEKNTQQTQMETQPQCTIEEKLSEILSCVKGAGNVEVLLTTAIGEETIYQTDSEETSDTIRVETVVVADAERAENGLIRQINPVTYRGAIIVCQGADDPAVKLAIVDAVSKATGLGADKISVMKMK